MKRILYFLVFCLSTPILLAQDIAVSNGVHFDIDISKYISDSGGNVRVKLRVKTMNHQGWNYIPTGQISYWPGTSFAGGLDVLLLDFSNVNISGCTKIYESGGACGNYDLYINNNIDRLPTPLIDLPTSVANITYSGNTTRYNIGNYYYVDFIWKNVPNSFYDNIDQENERKFNIDLSSVRYHSANGNDPTHYSHPSFGNVYDLNMQLNLADFGTPSVIDITPVTSPQIVKTDNSIKLNVAHSSTLGDVYRVVKGYKRVHTDLSSYNDIDGDLNNNLTHISNGWNAQVIPHIFDDLGPKQPNIYGKYEIWVMEINGTNRSFNKYKVDNIQTLPLISPSNIFAENLQDGLVKISWDHATSLPLQKLRYKVSHKLPTSTSYSDYAYLNYPPDSTYLYLEKSIDQTKTYMYKVDAGVNHSDMLTINGIENSGINFDSGYHSEGTGAGLDFFDSDDKIFNLNHDPECEAYIVSGSQVEVPQNDFIVRSNTFSFNPSGTTAEIQKIKLYSSLDCTAEVEGGSYSPGGYAYVSESFSGISIPDTVDDVSNIYAKIAAVRSDGKVFESFVPKTLPVNRITAPLKPIIQPIGETSSSSRFEGYSKVVFTKLSNDVIDEITIERLRVDSELSDAQPYIEDGTPVLPKSITLDFNNQEYIEISGNYITFTDKVNTWDFPAPDVCKHYKYKVKLINCANLFDHQTSSFSDPVIVTPESDVDVFTASKNLEVSDVKYKNKIHLNWNNNNDGIIDHYNIKRRKVGEEFTVIQTVPRYSKSFEDLYTESNILYEYQVVAVIPGCESSDVLDIDDAIDEDATVMTSDNVFGIRVPEVTVSGFVRYESNDPVEHIDVSIENGNLINYSIELTESPSIVKSDLFKTYSETSFTFSMWHKYSGTINNKVCILKRGEHELLNIENGEYIGYNYTTADVTASQTALNESQTALAGAVEVLNNLEEVSGDSTAEIEAAQNTLEAAEIDYANLTSSSDNLENLAWHHIAYVYNHIDNTVKLYINGQLETLPGFTLPANPFNDNDILCLANSNKIGTSYLNGLSGKLDEISVWKKVMTSSEVKSLSTSYISDIEDDDLLIYYHCDENGGKTLYDFSKSSSGSHHLNHLEFLVNIPYSSDAPNSNMIKYTTRTNNDGFYIVKGIRYKDDGELFTIIASNEIHNPYPTSHSFEPNQYTHYLGDLEPYISNLNFQDQTSVTVNGTVLYHVVNQGDDNITVIDTTDNEIGVSGVKVLLNGEVMQTADGEVLETDAGGNFTCTLPIGTQYLSFEKDGHTFEYEWKGDALAVKRGNSKQIEASFSASFESDLGEIVCNTYKELRGRITGGLTYQNSYGVNIPIENIPIGFGKEANTIGQVRFAIKQKDGSTDHEVIVTTDKTTGEYVAYVLPIQYSVDKSSFIASNSGVESAFGVDNTDYVFDNIDMSVKGSMNGDEWQEDTEESVDESNYDTSSNTIEFHNRYDLTYRTSPSISVQQQQLNDDTTPVLDWSDYLGETTYDLEGTDIQIKTAANEYALGKPVFKELYGDNTYQLKIDVREEYSNYGDLGSDLSSETDYFVDPTINDGNPFYHPLNEGTISIQNEMLESGAASFEVDGSTMIYEFAPDNPHVFGVDDGYERNFVVDYQNGTTNSHWPREPKSSPAVGWTNLEGAVYLFGKESYGNDFFTFGPQVVDMILRDPAGDASYSYIEEGATVTRTQSTMSVNGESAEYNIETLAGIKGSGAFEFGTSVFGFEVSSEWDWEATAQLSVQMENILEVSHTDENEITFYETFTEAISTNSEDFNIGAAGDVFLGESKNLNFGTSKKLHLIESAKCSTESVPNEIYECLNEVGDNLFTFDSVDYRLGTKTMPSIRPGTNTKFAFTANYIENYLIPKLYFIRNAYLIGTYNVFEGEDEATINNMVNHPCWGEELNSPCFDVHGTNGLSVNYYLIPQNETATTYQLPVLSNYSNNQMTNILGVTLADFQTGFNNSIEYTTEVNYTELLTYSVGGGDVGASNTTNVFENNLFGNSNENDIEEFINSINTGPSFDIASLSEDNVIDNFIDDFIQNQDFSNIPGIINLENMIDDLTDEVASEMENVIIPRDKVAFYNQQIKLWQRALAQNELDKIESDFITNHSISAGVEIENSHTSAGAYSSIAAVSYFLNEMDGEGFHGALQFGLGFSGWGIESQYWDNTVVSFEFETTSTVESESETTIGYFLSDDDQGDILSVDVNNSVYGYGPVFKTQAGATSCPHEPATLANYILDFEMYFELQFYDKLIEQTTQPLNDSNDDGVEDENGDLTFNYESYEFTWSGLTGTGENNKHIASWTDYRKIAKKKSTYDIDNTKPNLTAFETARKDFYDAVKTHAKSDFESEFGVTIDNTTFLIQGDKPEVELSATTSQREKPTLSVYPYNQYNVPEQEQAVFTITLGNESETGDDMVYILRVDEASNPNGAIIKVDGLSANREFMVLGGSTVTKTVTVEKGPRELSYENLGLILHSSCQYDFATADESDIADTVYFSAYFLPTCTEVAVEDTDEDWLVNLTDSGVVELKLKDYDLNYYSLEKIDLQYKFENEIWKPIESLESPLAVVNSENYKYMDALNLYNLLHSDFALPSTTVGEFFETNSIDKSSELKSICENELIIKPTDLEDYINTENLDEVAELEIVYANLTDDQYESIYSHFYGSEIEPVEYWFDILEPSEECEGTDCQLVDFQETANYTASDLSDDENRHVDWYQWKYSNAVSGESFLTSCVDYDVTMDGNQSSTSANNGSLSIQCFILKTLVEKKAYVDQEILRLKALHLESIPDSIPTTYYNSDDLMLSMRNQTSTFSWTMPVLPNDGEYLIRAKSYCGDFTPHTGGDTEAVIVYSPTYELYSDRIRPEVFGNIQPADGILDPNDEILLTFNEAINEMDFNVSTAETFVKVKAKKNGTQHTHDAYLYFDGADDMEIPSGVTIDGSFTLELWVKAETDGVLFEQSYGASSNTIKLELTGVVAPETPKLKFSFDDVSSLNDEAIIDHEVTLSSAGFTHIAVSYDANATTGQFTVYEGSSMTSYPLNMSSYGEGNIKVGEDYVGAIHDLRIWNTVRSSGDILANRSQSLSGREANLVGYWPMDELKGNPQDKARYRHATTSAQWAVDSENQSRTLDGTVAKVSQETTPIAITSTSDFTVEAWFKSSSAAHQTLFSLGEWGDGTQVGVWSIDLNNGNVEVYQSGNSSSTPSIASGGTNYGDGQWHHLTLVKSDVGNTRLYVDGNEVAQADSDNFSGIAVGKIIIGSRLAQTQHDVLGNYSGNTYIQTTVILVSDSFGDEVSTTTVSEYVQNDSPQASSSYITNSDNGDTTTTSITYTPIVFEKYLSGSLDEIRVWNLAKTTDQIVSDANNGLDTEKDANKNFVNEIGLEAYLHFDNEVEFVSDSDVPLVRGATTKTSVIFDDVSNGDQVYVNITDTLSKIENTILNITVQNVEDLNGNTIKNPITWDVFVDKNQLIWDEQIIEKEKLIGESMVFETHIVNQGGTVEQFDVSNLPDWLTAIPSEGLLAPNSFMQIEFVVNEDLFIGDYQEDLILTGNNNYGERLEFQLEVEAPAPIYDFDATEFLYTMNFVGMVTVDELRSRDEKDILFAYGNNSSGEEEIRGATNLIYLVDYDAYFAFFSVYSDETSGDDITFRLWDASEGKIQSQIELSYNDHPNDGDSKEDESSVVFQQGAVVGSFEDLTLFAASNMLRQEIPLNEGWNWVSFNLDAEDDASTQDSTNLVKETILSNVDNDQIEIVKNQTTYAQSYVGSILGSLTSFDIEPLYMFKMKENSQETIIYEGMAINPTDVPITINDGWNWIGYLGQRMLSTNEALSSLNPSSGDIIKSQTAFSMYANESLGWLGTLSNMQGSEGYMLEHSGDAILTYPESSMFGGGSFRLNRNQYADEFWTVNTNKYEHSMSMVATIDHIDYQEPNEENLLGAFAKAECLGNISSTVIDEEESLYFLTLYGVEDTRLRFDYYDAEKDKVYTADNVIDFVPNKTIGTIENPYPITIDVAAQDLEEFFALDVYPNPFVDAFEVVFTLEEEMEVEIQLFDVMGRFVKSISQEQLAEGIHQIQIDGEELTKGVYFIEVQVGENTYKKMIVKS